MESRTWEYGIKDLGIWNKGLGNMQSGIWECAIKDEIIFYHAKSTDKLG